MFDRRRCLIDCSSLFTPFQPLGFSLSTSTRTLSVPTLSGSRWSIHNIIIFSHPVSSPVSIYTTLSRVRSALAMVSNFPDCDWLVLLTFPDLCIDNISCSSPMDISATVCVCSQRQWLLKANTGAAGVVESGTAFRVRKYYTMLVRVIHGANTTMIAMVPLLRQIRLLFAPYYSLFAPYVPSLETPWGVQHFEEPAKDIGLTVSA